jgi:hypothetical protein
VYLYIVLVGIVGGVANGLLLQGGLSLPQIVKTDKGSKVDLGFFSPIVLGAVAALATDFLGGGKLAEDPSRIGLALLSGIGGGNVLSSLLQKQETAVLKTQMDALQQALASALKPVPPPNLTPAQAPTPVLAPPAMAPPAAATAPPGPPPLTPASSPAPNPPKN